MADTDFTSEDSATDVSATPLSFIRDDSESTVTFALDATTTSTSETSPTESLVDSTTSSIGLTSGAPATTPMPSTIDTQSDSLQYEDNGTSASATSRDVVMNTAAAIIVTDSLDPTTQNPTLSVTTPLPPLASTTVTPKVQSTSDPLSITRTARPGAWREQKAQTGLVAAESSSPSSILFTTSRAELTNTTSSTFIMPTRRPDDSLGQNRISHDRVDDVIDPDDETSSVAHETSRSVERTVIVSPTSSQESTSTSSQTISTEDVIIETSVHVADPSTVIFHPLVESSATVQVTLETSSTVVVVATSQEPVAPTTSQRPTSRSTTLATSSRAPPTTPAPTPTIEAAQASAPDEQEIIPETTISVSTESVKSLLAAEPLISTMPADPTRGQNKEQHLPTSTTTRSFREPGQSDAAAGANKQDQESTSKGVAAGAIVGGILGTLLLITLILCGIRVWKRTKRQDKLEHLRSSCFYGGDVAMPEEEKPPRALQSRFSAPSINGQPANRISQMMTGLAAFNPLGRNGSSRYPQQNVPPSQGRWAGQLSAEPAYHDQPPVPIVGQVRSGGILASFPTTPANRSPRKPPPSDFAPPSQGVVGWGHSYTSPAGLVPFIQVSSPSDRSSSISDNSSRSLISSVRADPHSTAQAKQTILQNLARPISGATFKTQFAPPPLPPGLYSSSNAHDSSLFEYDPSQANRASMADTHSVYSTQTRADHYTQMPLPVPYGGQRGESVFSAPSVYVNEQQDQWYEHDTHQNYSGQARERQSIRWQDGVVGDGVPRAL